MADTRDSAAAGFAPQPLVTRVLSALALLVPTLGSVVLGGWIFVAWVSLLGVLMTFEWHTIAYRSIVTLAFGLHVVGLLAAAILTGFGQAEWAILVIAGGALVGGLSAFMSGRPSVWAILGLPYTGLGIIGLLWLRAAADPGLVSVLWLLAVVWATDTGAFAVGRALGGPKLAPRLSPQKTWAGLGGGVAAAMLVGAVTGIWVEAASSVALAGASGVLAVIGQLGDLTESAFKRRFGVKDSSRLIPGQGGILDRVDGLIFVTVTVAVMALLQQGHVEILKGWP